MQGLDFARTGSCLSNRSDLANGRRQQADRTKQGPGADCYCYCCRMLVIIIIIIALSIVIIIITGADIYRTDTGSGRHAAAV